MKNKMSFSATGDSLIVKRIPKGYGGFLPVSEYIKSGQARLSNLETVISDFDCFPSAFSGGTWVNARPEILPDLLDFGFNMFGCANNHSLDYSYKGLESTIAALKSYSVAFAGIGMNLFEAAKPAILDLPSGRVAVISICSSFENAARANHQTAELPGRPGLNPLRSNTVYTITSSHMKALKEIAQATLINGGRDNSKKAGFIPESPEGIFSFGGIDFREGACEQKSTRCNEIDLERTKKGISDALRCADYAVVMAHSHQIKGSLYHEPDYFFEEFCRACIDSGACAVIGSGTHQLKPLEIYKGKPIFYSLGNFIFQNESVEILPIDFLEKHNMPANLTAAEALCARSRNGTIGLGTDRANYKSVIPYFELENGRITKLVLKPIELGFNLSKTFKGLPFEADVKTTDEIFEHFSNISKQYGTVMKLKENLIEVEI